MTAPTDSNLQKTVLYSYFRSSASHRVRIAMNLKSISYEYRPVHLLNNGGEQLTEEFRKLNPSREVPTLIHNGNVISQSMAIVDYLDSIHSHASGSGATRLFPLDPAARAKVLQACEVINSGQQPLVNLRVLKELKKQFGTTDEQNQKWVHHWFEYALSSFNALIQPYVASGPFCFGSHVSAADCFLIPALKSAIRFEFDFGAQFPHLNKIYLHCGTLPAFVQAAPENQPDFPKS